MDTRTLRRANEAFLRGEYGASVEWALAADERENETQDSTQEQSDYTICQKKAEEKLGMAQTANNMYTDSIGMRHKIHFSKGFGKKIDKGFRFKKKKPFEMINGVFEDEFSRMMSGSFIKKMNDINREIQNKKDSINYSVRCNLFGAIGDKKSALDDAVKMTVVDPMNPNLWKIKAECSNQMNEMKLSYDAAKNCEKLNAPNYIYYAHYFWDMNDVTNAMKYVNLAVKNKEQCSQFVRAKFNLKRGYLKEALKDDPSLPIYIFGISPFPSKIPENVTMSCPFIYDLLLGYYFSFHKPLYDIPHGLFVPLQVQFAWFHGINLNPQSRQLPCFQIPSINNSSKSWNNMKEMFKHAFNFGKYVDKRLLSSRTIVCIGFAILEVSQLISSYLKGKHIHLPTLETIYSIILNWLRFTDPSIPIFLRTDIPNFSRKIYFEKSGSKTYLSEYTPRLFNLLKKHFKLNSNEIKKKIDMAQTPKDFWNIFRRPIIVPIPNTKISIFLDSPKFSLIDFGLILTSDGDVNLDEKLISKWYSIMNNIKSGVVTKEIFEFIYIWLCDNPFTYNSDISAIILLLALVHGIFELVPNTSFPIPSEFLFHTLECDDFDSFLVYLSSLGITYTTLKSKIKPVCVLLPNLHVRYQVLLELLESNHKCL